MIKKLLTCLLVLAMVISFLPANSTEAHAAGNNITAPANLPYSDEEWEILSLINKERYVENLDPMTGFELMQEVGNIRADELTEFYSHDRPDGTDCFTVITELGIPWMSLGENIAYGYQTSADVMNGWMNSEGHRGNIMSPKFAHVGIGLQYDEYGIPYWIQMFVDGGSYTSFQLMTPDKLEFEKGTTIEEMGLYAVLNSTRYGDCYLPIISEYCTGIDVESDGLYNVSISALGYSANITITIGNPISNPAAKIGDKAYATLSDALNGAKPNDTVIMHADATISETFLRNGVTLDLNGHTLTTNYVFAVNNANIMDNTRTGLLKVDKENIVLPASNSMLPVWNDKADGYTFTQVNITDNSQGMGFVVDTEKDTAALTFVTFFRDTALLLDGCNDNDLSVNVRMTWTVMNEDGSVNGVATQEFVFSNDQVSQVVTANGKKAFRVTLTNYSTLKDLSMQVVVVSGTNAEICGTQY